MGLKIEKGTVYENGAFKKKHEVGAVDLPAQETERADKGPGANKAPQALSVPEVKTKVPLGSSVKSKKKKPTQGKKTPASDK